MKRKNLILTVRKRNMVWHRYGRVTILAILVFVFMLAAAGARADGKIDVKRQEMLEFVKKKDQAKAAYHRKQSGSGLSKGWSDSVSVTISGNLEPCATLTFSATAAGNEHHETLVYKWGLCDEGRDSSGWIYYPQYDEAAMVGMSSIQYMFYSAGEYSVCLYVYDENGSFIGYNYTEFTIPPDGTHPTLEEKAQSVVNECRGATEWQTAVNLYDWLTHNAYYDETYETHGADIILRGYGVCDSYSKAYELLCETAGIPVERTFGTGHAWNALKLGGKWYQADPTWDDPGWAMPGEGSAVSGSEGHRYFCVNATAMAAVRSHCYDDGTQGGTHAAECTSMDANYFIHENLWQGFGGDYYWPAEGNGWIVNPYIAQIQEAFDSGVTNTEMRIYSYVYYMQNGEMTGESFEPSILREILKAGMATQQFFLDSDAVRVAASFSEEDYQTVMAVKICGWDIAETGTLTLPEDTARVEDEAFAGTAATTVVFPEGCGVIGDHAFDGSAVRTVVIPGPVSSIADNAFYECGKIMFITADQTVKEFAENHGFVTVEP